MKIIPQTFMKKAWFSVDRFEKSKVFFEKRTNYGRAMNENQKPHFLTTRLNIYTLKYFQSFEIESKEKS